MTNVFNDLDKEWASFLNTPSSSSSSEKKESKPKVSSILPASLRDTVSAPPSTDIYISTQTKIVYLNQPVDLKTTFWNIPVMSFDEQREGVLKKQMKFNSMTPEELADIQKNLQNEPYYEEYVLTSINNPQGRIKFKDIRKVSVGRRSKDMVPHRGKQKSAFYNCFVLIFRMETQVSSGLFKEYHVKVFNTGKLEIPGIQQSGMLPRLVDQVVTTLRPWVGATLAAEVNGFDGSIRTETVLINSNFHCGFTLHRERLYDILKSEYHIPTIYDPCSYPGIQCKLAYHRTEEGRPVVMCMSPAEMDTDMETLEQGMAGSGKQVLSFMIFRTGSVLLVGKCEEDVLYMAYETLKEILAREYSRIVIDH